jgi:hypothetical protein
LESALAPRGRAVNPFGFSKKGREARLNVARNGARLAAAWRRPLSGAAVFDGEASLRYVGQSKLGVGDFLDIPQGGYLVVDAAARVDLGRVGVSINLDNVGDARANTFAFGNPFGLAERDQITPLRPRTIRVGVNARF